VTRSALFFAVSFLQALDNQLVAVLMPELSEANHLASWLLTAYAVACGIVPFLIAGSRHVEHLKKLGIAALVVLAAGAFVFATATSFPVWIFVRAAAGAASGLLSMTLLLSAARIEDPAARAREFTVITAGQLTAIVVGIPLVASLPWTRTYPVIGAACLLFAALFGIIAPRSLSPKTPPRPLLLREVLANRRPALVLIATGLVGMVMAGPIVSLSTFLKGHDFTKAAIGAVYMWSGVGPLLAMPIAGRLSARWSPRRVAIAGSVLIAAPLCVFSVLAVTLPAAALLMLVCVFIETLRRAALQGALAEVVDRPDLPRYLAFRGVILQLGLAAGYAIGGAAFTALGFGFVCWFAAGLSILAAVVLTFARAPAVAPSPQHHS
jgi:predicted MFS family arabinose efflux permease